MARLNGLFGAKLVDDACSPSWRRSSSPPTSACAPPRGWWRRRARSVKRTSWATPSGSRRLIREEVARIVDLARRRPAFAARAARAAARGHGRGRQRLGQDDDHRQARGEAARARARRCCSPRATPSAPPPPSSSTSGRERAGAPIGPGQGGRRSRRGRLRRGAERRARTGVDVVIVRHRRPAPHQGPPDGGAEEGEARDGQGAAGRAARGAAGARLHQRPERHRPGAAVPRGGRRHRHRARPSSTAPPRAASSSASATSSSCRCAASASARGSPTCALRARTSSSRRCSTRGKRGAAPSSVDVDGTPSRGRRGAGRWSGARGPVRAVAGRCGAGSRRHD